MMESSRSLGVVPPPSSSHVNNTDNLLLACMMYLAYVCVNLLALKQCDFLIPR
jgi:hypothetical protein